MVLCYDRPDELKHMPCAFVVEVSSIPSLPLTIRAVMMSTEYCKVLLLVAPHIFS